MALIKLFEDPCGNVYPESYWRISSIQIDTENDHANICLLGYKNREAGQKPRKNSIGSVSITIANDAYLTALAQEESKTKIIREICYELAKAMLKKRQKGEQA